MTFTALEVNSAKTLLHANNGCTGNKTFYGSDRTAKVLNADTGISSVNTRI